MANILASNPLTARIAQMFPMSPDIDPNANPDVSNAFQTSTDVTGQAPNPPINIADRMQALYHPQNSIMNQYGGQLNAMPDRNDPRYQPSGMRRVLASLAGVGARSGADAFNTSRGIVNAPYDQDLSDWEAKTKAYGEGARIEDTGNKDARALAEKQIDQEITASKEKDIFNTKVADLERKISEADRTAKIREAQLQANQNSATALQNFHNAQLAQRDAQHELEKLKYEQTLAESKRKEDEFNRTILQKEEQLQATRDYNKARLAGQDVSNYVVDKDGNVLYSTQSHKGPGGEEKTIRVIDENNKSGQLKGTEDQIQEWLRANNKRKRAPIQMNQ